MSQNKKAKSSTSNLLSGLNKKLACSTNASKNKNRVKKMYDDMYGIHLGVKELKMSDFQYNETTRTLVIQDPTFQHLKKGIIVFYAPWCPHCINMYDDVVELSITYANIFPVMVVNIEDIKNHNDTLTQYAKVKKYPSLRTVNQNCEVEDTSVETTKEAIHYYINMNL